MYISNKSQASEDQVKELKVRIPVEQHLQLHSLKVMTGKHISDAVTEALRSYFQAVRQQDRTRADPSLDE